MKQIYTMEIVHARCKPTFQHEYALSQLKSRGYSIAVCSNSIRNSIELMMEKANLGRYLDFILSNEDVQFAKPDPEIYNKAIAMLGLNPAECLVVEDNENGIRAAKASGAQLLEVESVSEVNITNILSRVEALEKGSQV
jgi:HAD superfamily hydrolase (TIGR01509 family)